MRRETKRLFKDRMNKAETEKDRLDVYYIAEIYETAQDYHYFHILDKIKNARNSIHAENILIDAHRAS